MTELEPALAATAGGVAIAPPLTGLEAAGKRRDLAEGGELRLGQIVPGVAHMGDATELVVPAIGAAGLVIFQASPNPLYS